MFNCDHCQKKYKRSWHQARHSQMKHENSNASTATTSSAGTPPTPEINGNIPNNSNYNYQQMQQVPQMPSQPIVQDLNQIALTHQHQNQQQNVTIPPASSTWNPMPHPQQQHHSPYAATNEMVDTKSYNVQQPVEQVNNGEYASYVVNEQYSNKFEQAQPTPVGAVNPTSYDSWVNTDRDSLHCLASFNSFFYFILESPACTIFLGLQPPTAHAANVPSAAATGATNRMVLRSKSSSAPARVVQQRI